MVRKSRGFVFTLNNYTEDEYLQVKSIPCRFMVVGREVGESGTPHLQGFVYFENGRSELSIRGLLPRAHVECQKGSNKSAIEYCKKEGDFIEIGNPPKDGAGANKWKEVYVMAKQRKWVELAECFPSYWIRYESSLRRQGEYFTGTLGFTDRNKWYWGRSGTGKSRKAREVEPLYLKKRNKWWDGYDNEDTVLIEEWSPDLKHTAQELKIWADIYSFPAEIKGGMIVIRPKLIIVTSNYSIEECFDERDIEAVRRRFEVVHFDNLC